MVEHALSLGEWYEHEQKRYLSQCNWERRWLSAGTFEVEVSNEQLHSALTAPAFRLVTALGAQVAATFSDEPEAPATAAVGRRAGVQRSSAAGASSSGGSAGGMASSAAAPPVRVLENVQEDAYRCALHLPGVSSA